MEVQVPSIFGYPDSEVFTMLSMKLNVSICLHEHDLKGRDDGVERNCSTFSHIFVSLLCVVSRLVSPL